MNAPDGAGVPSGAVEGDRLDDDQIALVLRRASELDGQALAGRAGLDLERLEEAAVEAGLSRESVRRAVAELRVGSLAVDPGGGRGRGGWRRRPARPGPAVVTVSRCVPGPAAAVDGILRDFLRHELFHLRRDFGTRSTWSRRQDVATKVRISYDRGIHRRLRLREAEEVEMAVVGEPGSDDRLAVVKITVDVRPLRRVHRVAVGKGVAAGGLVALGGLALLSTPEALVAMPVAAAAGLAGGHAMGASRYRSLVDEVETSLEGFLDGVERRDR